MTQPKTMYDVNKLSLEELRAWLLSQNVNLPPAHRNQQSLHGLRELAFKQLAEIKEEKRRIVQRNQQFTLRMRDRAAATSQAAKIMFSQEPASSKSTGCIPLEKKLGLVPVVKVSSDDTSSQYNSKVASPTSSTRSNRQQHIRDANNSTTSSALMPSMEGASRFSRTAMPVAIGFFSTSSLTPSLVSVGSSSGSSIPKSLGDEPLQGTCSLPSDQIEIRAEASFSDSEAWQSESKEFLTLPTESSSAHKVPQPWAMSYDVISGKPIAQIFSASSSASLEKPNGHERLPIDIYNSSSLEPECKLPSPTPIHAILPMKTKRTAVEEKRERFSSKECMLSTSSGAQQKPLMLGDSKLNNMQAELLSSRSEGDATRDSTLEVLPSAVQISHPWEFHESGISQVVDEHCQGREQGFMILNSKLSSMHVSSSSQKAGSEKEAAAHRSGYVLQLTRRATASSRISNRSSSPASTTSSSVNSSYSACTSVTSSSSDAFSPLRWRPRTLALLACIAAVFSVFLLSKYKQYLEEHERQRYWWT